MRRYDPHYNKASKWVTARRRGLEMGVHEVDIGERGRNELIRRDFTSGGGGTFEKCEHRAIHATSRRRAFGNSVCSIAKILIPTAIGRVVKLLNKILCAIARAGE